MRGVRARYSTVELGNRAQPRNRTPLPWFVASSDASSTLAARRPRRTCTLHSLFVRQVLCLHELEVRASNRIRTGAVQLERLASSPLLHRCVGAEGFEPSSSGAGPDSSAVGLCACGPRGIRTRTVMLLKHVPLPVGIEARGSSGNRTPSSCLQGRHDDLVHLGPVLRTGLEPVPPA
jgi:hypothetical protein